MKANQYQQLNKQKMTKSLLPYRITLIVLSSLLSIFWMAWFVHVFPH